MGILAIDVGNTNTVLGVFAGSRLVRSWRVRTDSRTTADEMTLQFGGLLGHQWRPTGIAALSTVPTVLREMRVMLARAYAGVPTVVVEPGVRTGVPLVVDNPKEVGADRVVNTLAAHHLYGGPVVVVDFGTSTNLDAVSANGEFLGGALAPGIEISVDALAARAAALRKVELVRPRSVVGRNTIEALQSGIIFGFAGQVDGLVRRMVRELGPDTRVIATGGLAGVVMSESETIEAYEPHLTLVGLRLVYLRNHPEQRAAESEEAADGPHGVGAGVGEGEDEGEDTGEGDAPPVTPQGWVRSPFQDG